jgi:hypothetical protein
MAREPKIVGSDEVRIWANETGWRDESGYPVAERGRMPSSLITAYNNANRRYNKQYAPQPRPVRADIRAAQEAAAGKAKATEKAEPPKARGRQKNEDKATAEVPAQRATSQAAQATDALPVGPVSTGEAGVHSLEDVIAMLTAAENKKGTRKAVVTIQTLVNV